MSVTFLDRIKHATSPRLARWSTAMSPLLSKATWTHISGTKNLVPDLLSRQIYPPEEPIEGEEDLLYDDMNFGILSTEASMLGDLEYEDWFEDEDTLAGNHDGWSEIEMFLKPGSRQEQNDDDDMWIYSNPDNQKDWMGYEEAYLIQALQEQLSYNLRKRALNKKATVDTGDNVEEAQREETVEKVDEVEVGDINLENIRAEPEMGAKVGIEICAG